MQQMEDEVGAAFARWYIIADPGDRSWGNGVQRIATIVGPRLEAAALTDLLNMLNDGNQYGYQPALNHP